MNTIRTLVTGLLVSLVYGCGHPIVITGEGDVVSATGTRDCSLEDYQLGADSCSKNLVVNEYQETYIAVPRPGWQFVAWKGCYFDGATGDQCSFDIDASVVRKFWFATMPPLIAVFYEIDPTPLDPVAEYSYALDAAGNLLNPQPLEGEHLQRRSVYFSVTGEYSAASFWCCEVVGGTEEHMPAVEDDTAPFVLRVDMGALPEDGGLEREFLAHLFVGDGDYEKRLAHWTLESPLQTPMLFDDGAIHTIDYTIPSGVIVDNRTNINLLAGAKLAANVQSGSPKESAALQVLGESTANIYAGSQVEDGIWCEASQLNVFAGVANRIECHQSQLSIQGGETGHTGLYYSTADLVAGEIASLYAEASRVTVTGGTIGGDIIGASAQFAISGGVFLGSLRSPNAGDASYTIKGGQFNRPFSYNFTGQTNFTFHGELTLSDPVLVANDQYQSDISGTLADGTSLSQKIICTDSRVPGVALPVCSGVKIINP